MDGFHRLCQHVGRAKRKRRPFKPSSQASSAVPANPPLTIPIKQASHRQSDEANLRNQLPDGDSYEEEDREADDNYF
jgi:hypothetical protein